jgi:hypothetical protein
VCPPAQALEGHHAGRANGELGGVLKGGEDAITLSQTFSDLLPEPVPALGDDAADEPSALGALAHEMADDHPPLGGRNLVIQEAAEKLRREMPGLSHVFRGDEEWFAHPARRTKPPACATSRR